MMNPGEVMKFSVAKIFPLYDTIASTGVILFSQFLCPSKHINQTYSKANS